MIGLFSNSPVLFVIFPTRDSKLYKQYKSYGNLKQLFFYKSRKVSF
jgi:hypothetical protein